MSKQKRKSYDKDKIMAMHRAGHSISEISLSLNVPKDSVKYRIEKEADPLKVSLKREPATAHLLTLRNEHGNKCNICGYDKPCQRNYEFHHLDARLKHNVRCGNSTLIGMLMFLAKFGLEAGREECDKCILLCKNCHGEVEAGLTPLPKEYEDKRLKLLEELDRLNTAKALEESNVA